MDPTEIHSSSSSLNCELRLIIEAKNIAIKSRGVLFVRCYLPAGNNKRVKLESHQIPSKSNSITWNQTFSLDCTGSQDSVKWLKQETLVFELRWRTVRSELVAQAKVPWKNLLDSTNMEIERWVAMIPQNGYVHDDLKPPVVKIAMKIQEFDEGIERKKINGGRWSEGCGCADGGCKSILDYEFFAIDAVLEAL
ncbi:hypothetical protein CDL12_00484 [Handroanthus impetiginosus]|uniref:C2 domain-containing protein n=1 Tax=Handroanthus impetiginosus TaxID=429701 RepID=A0A2G9IAI7_9LAMI|nr:hypothetical protein CDL12_00484 [Handroanthus impetiginosus]